MNERHESMRGWFAAELHDRMVEDERVWLLTGDLGFGMLDRIRDDFPDRYLNTGAAEQAMIGAAVGLALAGKIPFCYSITPFLLYRPFEWLRNYLDHEGAAVRLVGSGFGTDYEKDGFSHHASEAKEVLKLLPNIKTFWPDAKEQVPDIVKEMLRHGGPSFLCLRR